MKTYKYKVFGYRYRHITSDAWTLCKDLPDWLRRIQPKNKRWWIVERLYYREEQT